MNIELLFVLISFAGLTFAGPILDKGLSKKCTQECKDPTKFSYKQGKSYVYNYDTSTSLLLNEKSTQVKINGQAVVTPLYGCEYSLKLIEIKINGVPDQEVLEKALMKDQLKFAFNDGTIPNICHSAEEPKWVLNVKKAVLSALQVSIEQFGGFRVVDEIDLFGECETQYNSISKSFAEGTQIKKTKNLLTCKEYVNSKFAPLIHSMMTNESKPVFECDQVVTVDGVLKSVYCEESFKSDSKSLSKFKKMSKLSLTFDSIKDALVTDNLKEFKVSNMLFERESKKAKTFDQVKSITMKLCKEIENSVYPSAPRLIHKLARSIKDVSYDELNKLWKEISEEKECKSKRIKTFFVNAVVNSRSHSSIEFLVNKLKPEGLISDRAYEYALWSLVFANEPCPYMVKAITPLFKTIPSEQALFGMTAMVQNHIETHPQVSMEAVEGAINELVSTIDAKKPAEAVLRIRALGNIHHSTPIATENLLNLAKDANLPAEVRVAALDSLKRMDPFNEQVQKATEDLIYNQKDAPIEVRVAAYKVYVQSSNPAKIWEVMKEKKDDTNLASYIKTHLFNAKRSVNLDKANLRQDLFNTKIPMVKLSDGPSLNLEFSHMKSDRSAGVVSELDWIVKSGHLTPSYVVTNVSFPFSKHLLNVLEIGIVPKESATLESLMNPKDFNMDSLKKLFTLKPKLIDSIYFKWLDKTLLYYNSQKEAGKAKAKSSILYFLENSPLVYLFETGYSHIFYDRVFSYPALNGLHVELSTRTVLLNGMKVSSITEKNGDKKKSKFEVHPNFFVDHERKMGVYVGGRNSKSKGDILSKFVIRTNFSSTGEAEGNDTKVAITFDIGDEPVNLVKIESIKHLHHFKGEKEVISTDHKPQTVCTTDYTEKALGIELCVQTEIDETLEKTLPKGFKMHLILRKTDKSLKGYKILGDVDKSDKKINAKFELDAPGSSIDRKSLINFNFEGDRDWKLNMKKMLNINVKSPQYKFDGNASLNTQEYGESTANLEFTVNDKNRRDFKVKVDRKQTNDGTVDVKSNWKVISPKLNGPLDLSANLFFDKHKELKADVNVNDNGKAETIFKLNYVKEGSIKAKTSRAKRSNDKDDLKMTLGLQVGGQKHDQWLNMKSKIEKKELYNWEAKVDYKKPGQSKQRAELSTKFGNEGSKDETKLKSEAEMLLTEYPQLNFKMEGKLNHKPKQELVSEMNLRWGDKSEGDKKKLHLLKSYKIDKYETGKNLKGKGVFKVTFSPKDFEHQIDYDVLVENYPAKVEFNVDHKNLKAPKEIRKAVYRRSTDVNDPYLTSIYANYKYPNGEHHFNQETSKLENNHYKKKGLYKHTTSDGKISGYNFKSELKNEPHLKSHSMEVTTYPDDKPVIKSDQIYEKEDKKLNLNSKVYYQGDKVYEAKYLSNDNNYDGSAEVKAKQYAFMGRLAKNGPQDIRVMFDIADAKQGFKHKSDVTYSTDKKSIESETMINGQNVAMLEANCEKNSKRVYLKAKDGLSFLWSQNMDGKMVQRRLNATYTDDKQTIDVQAERWNNENANYLNWKEIEKGSFDLTYNNKPNNRNIKLRSKLDSNNFRFNYDHQKEEKMVALVDGKWQKGKRSLVAVETPSLSSFFECNHEDKVKHVKLKLNSKVSKHKLDLECISHHDSDTTKRKEFNVEVFIPPNNSLKTNQKSSYTWVGDNLQVETNTKRVIKTDKYDFTLENTGKGTFSKNLLTGPHSFNLKSVKNGQEILNSDLKYTYTNGVINGNLKVTGPEKMYLDAQLEGKVEGNLSEKGSLLGTLKIDSDYEKMKNISYSIDYNKEPKQRKLRVIRQKFGNATHDLDYISTKGDKKCHKLVKMTFLNPDKSKGVLDVEMEYSNKLKLNASLKESIPNSDNVISELKVDVPLVSISKFIGNHATMSFELPIQGSKVYAEYKAPTTKDIKLETGVIFKQSPYFVYEMNIMEAANEKSKVGSLATSPLLMKNVITIKDYPKIVENDIIFLNDKIVYEFKTKPGMVKLSYDKSNSEAEEITAQVCSRNDDKVGRCGSIDVKKKKQEHGHEYDITTKLDRADGNVDKLLIKTNCHKDEKGHHFKFIGTYNDRRYGHECSQVMTEKGKMFTVKLYLPERAVKASLESSNSTQDGSKVEDYNLDLWLDADRKENQKMTVKRTKKTLTDTPDSKHWNSKIEITHPVLAEPLKIDTTYNMASKNDEKSRSLETRLEYSKEAGKALNFKGSLATSNTKSAKSINYNIRMYQDDNVIDFGCQGLLALNDLADKYNMIRNGSCYWIDRNGTKKTTSKQESMSRSKTSKYISFDADYDHPIFNYHYVGDVHLIDKNQASSSIDLFLENDQKLRTKISLNKTDYSNCILINSTRVPIDKDTPNYDFGACILPANTFNESVFKMFAIENQMTSGQPQSLNKFSLDILRMKHHPNDYLVSIKWDPEILGTVLVSLADQLDLKRESWAALAKEVEEEMKHKMKLLEDGVISKVIKPMMKHLSTEKENFEKEMKPEIDYVKKMINEKIKREKRSLQPSEIDPTVKDLEDMLDIKFTVYNPEAGELELIFKNFKSLAAYKRWSNIVRKLKN